ncbi:MAG: hypothetical protein KAW14_06380 [Candidatus Aegiribacteria sp.]|nr:hypothetical protein [Candidatus Aegiribacteria sp.]
MLGKVFQLIPPVFLFLALMMLNPLSIYQSIAEILLMDDFSEDLDDRWILFGEPLPILCDSMGLPPPSFDNNGDTMYSSGAFSRESFEYAGGLVLECDMYVTSNPRGAWISGRIGLDQVNEKEYGPSGAEIPEITMSYNYCGEANWGCPHLQGEINVSLRTSSDSLDSHVLVHRNEFLDSWHRFRIVLEPDLRASFYIDSIHIYTTELNLPPDLGPLSIYLGDRSNSYGRVFHDNLVLRTLE